ncbi:MAG: amino acid permease [Phycisphaerales bacterium]|nr:amino acid permease [Phycisphaerales bacterium]
MPVGPKRVLGAFDAGCIVVGAIIGVGIFSSPGGVVQKTGDGTLALIAWAVGGVIAMCGALVFAELGGRYNASGAQYGILRESYGRLPAFMYVFCNATAIQAGAIGVIAIICVQSLAAAVGGEPPSGWWLTAACSVLVMGIALANMFGVKAGAGIQNFTVIAKVLTLLVVTCLAVFGGAQPPDAAAEVVEGGSGHGPVAGIMAALVPAFFAFGGWQHALWISGEVKNPVKSLPRAIVGGVAVVITVYLLANWAYIHLLGAGGVAKSKVIAADAVWRLWGDGGRRAIAAAVAISALGVLNAQLLSGPRLVYRMAIEGQFFRPFGVLSKRFGTPWAAILMMASVAIVLMAIAGDQGVMMLGDGAVFIDGVFFALTAAALLIVRVKEKRRAGPGVEVYSGFKVPGYPVVPLVFVVGELALLTGSYLDPSIRKVAWVGMIWIAAAALLYVVKFRKSPPAGGSAAAVPVECRQCGYAQAGLQAEQGGVRCPECGTMTPVSAPPAP